MDCLSNFETISFFIFAELPLSSPHAYWFGWCPVTPLYFYRSIKYSSYRGLGKLIIFRDTDLWRILSKQTFFADQSVWNPVQPKGVSSVIYQSVCQSKKRTSFEIQYFILHFKYCISVLCIEYWLSSVVHVYITCTNVCSKIWI